MTIIFKLFSLSFIKYIDMRYIIILLIVCSCKTYNIQNVEYTINMNKVDPLRVGADYQAPRSELDNLPDPVSLHGDNIDLPDYDELKTILKSLPQPVQNVRTKAPVVVGNDNTVSSGKAPAISGDSVVVADRVDQSEETTTNDMGWLQRIGIWVGVAGVVVIGLVSYLLIRRPRS